MRFCRNSHKISPKRVADHLGITIKDYLDIERGNILLTETQARKLGGLFNVRYSYFARAALQLDLLLTREAVINILKRKIEQLEEKKDEKAGATV